MKRGFTLVELLAVIVILAIIALVATPLIFNIIDHSRKSAAKSSAFGYVDAVERELALDDLDESKYNIQVNKKIFINENSFFSNLNINGNKPTSGIIILNKNKSVSKADLCVDNYYVSYDGLNTSIVSNNCDFDIESTLTYKIVEDINIKSGTETCVNNNGTYSDSCYFSGDRNKITSNKILYTGFIWDIIGIEENGDLVLISEQPLTTISYGNYDSLDESYVGKWLNEVFREKIKGTDLELNLKKITLLSKDEYLKYNGTNSYLDTRTSMWLRDPKDNNQLKIVNNSGGISNVSPNEAHGVRPVITIENNFVTGTGTYDNMYKIIMDKTSSNNDSVSSLKNGDFVKLGDKYTVRVTDNKTLKVTLHGILNQMSSFSNRKYAGSNLENYLKNTFSNDSSVKNYIDTTNHVFNIGNYNLGGDYETVKTETYTGYIALPTIGELFSGSDLFIQIQNLNNTVSYLPNLSNQTNNQWLLSPCTDCNYEIGYNGFEKITNNNTYGIRPTFYLKNNLVIKSGDGSPNNPYVIQ